MASKGVKRGEEKPCVSVYKVHSNSRRARFYQGEQPPNRYIHSPPTISILLSSSLTDTSKTLGYRGYFSDNIRWSMSGCVWDCRDQHTHTHGRKERLGVL